MKIKITQPGAFDKDGKEIKVGTVVTVDGDEMPSAYLNKAEAVDASAPAEEATDDSAAEKVAVTNPQK